MSLEDNDVLYIDDLSDDFAAKFAVKFAESLGEAVDAGIVHKYYAPDGGQIGFIVNYVKDGLPYGYVVLDFTLENAPVTEFMLSEGVSFVTDSGDIVSALSDDNVVDGVYMSDFMTYDSVSSDLSLLLSIDDDGKIHYESKDDVYLNMYRDETSFEQFSIGVISEYMTSKYDPELSFVIQDDLLWRYGKYNCGVAAALAVIKQEHATSGFSEEYIYEYLWKKCQVNIPWDATVDSLKGTSDESAITPEFTLENGEHAGETLDVIAAGIRSGEFIATGLRYWFNWQYGDSRFYTGTVSTTEMNETRIKSEINKNISLIYALSVNYGDESKEVLSHAVNLLGYKETVFGDNDHKTLWLAVADGYRDGLRYINFTDNPWDRSLNERYRFMVIRLFRN